MCHFLILSYATFGHCCKQIKTLRSVRSLSDPKQQGKKLVNLPGSTAFSDMERQSQSSWPWAVPSSEESISLSVCWLINFWSQSLLKREVESRKGEESQGKKANPSENLDHFLLFLGLVFLCLTCCMSTTVSAIMEKKNFSLNKHLRATAKGHERWEDEGDLPALLFHGWQVENGWHCWRALSFWERMKGNLA